MSSNEPTTVAEVANQLWEAEHERTPVEPLAATRPDLTLEEAYAIQARNVARRVATGSVARGRKAGVTWRAWQELLGVHEPGFGVLLDDMFVEDGDEIAADALIQPRIESETALVMGTDLAGPGVTTTDALIAISAVLPAIEVVDSRIADWRIELVDSVADNASCGRVVLGGRVTPVAAIDLRLVGMLLYRNGSPIESGAGASVLGNPARSVAWLANRLGSIGERLRRGDIVLPGALHRMVPVRPGDIFHAQFAHLGSVTVQFGERSAA
ncbi:2-keto-4-pentenoate hydratase [Pseudonocardia asaccharolytica]|uniref:2-keto-4-pentenoate hydratase n=1 Tax=Pseudonocardia asaccharolytica DSM 44247 = NBRC 16224 TaxID=1123024 RepID=A0A511D217_9PSEU|nr:2-keto-4-pentenoate hydratase [Pseudonocardia asaccharolytica]GEL18825.1 2-keto-4-pentenoate hydratase [Pseudonocardia asaccharolytica DSM 44247 = NBRC 16224]